MLLLPVKTFIERYTLTSSHTWGSSYLPSSQLIGVFVFLIPLSAGFFRLTLYQRCLRWDHLQATHVC